MDVSCPRCDAFLVLPVTVVGQAVRCPRCGAILHAEAGRLVAAGGVTCTAVAAPVTSAIFADARDDGDDDQPDDIFRDRAAEAIERLRWAAFALRMAAIAGLLTPIAVAVMTAMGRLPEVEINGFALLVDGGPPPPPIAVIAIAREATPAAICGLVFALIPCALYRPRRNLAQLPNLGDSL